MAEGLYQKHYYPINALMWEEFLKFYTEEQLLQMGLLKTDYLEIDECQLGEIDAIK